MAYDDDRGGYRRNDRSYRDNQRSGGYGNKGGDRGNRYQSSFVGKKRGRDEETADDPRKAFVKALMTLGDINPKSQDQPDLITATEEVVKMIKREMLHRNHTTEDLMQILLDCVTELSTKTLVYALLTGLLNVDESDLANQFLSYMSKALSSALASPSPEQHARARHMVRFVGCLARVNVIQPSAALQVMTGLVQTALTYAKSGSDPSGATWQPWSDSMVYVVLAALPWSGADLYANCPGEMTSLMDMVEEYMQCRPIHKDVELRPFLQPIKEGDRVAESDSGGASFLPWLWSAISACHNHDTKPWQVQAIRNILEGYGIQGRLAVGATHDLPEVVIPSAPPATDLEGYKDPNGDEHMDGGHKQSDTAEAIVRAAYVRKCYPARGGIRFFDPSQTEGDRPLIERFVVEEYILDTLTAFDADRAHCVRLLTSGLPVKWAHGPLLAETIFSAMLALPHSRVPFMHACVVLVELCKVKEFMFPKFLYAVMRECYNRLSVIDPELSPRLVDFLSYHLTNFDFQWPWDKWIKAVGEAPAHPQRRFCQQVISKLVRLSYWGRVYAVLPVGFRKLLGPVPKTPHLPGEVAPGPPAAGRAQNGSAQQQTDEDGTPMEGGEEAAQQATTEMQTDEQQQEGVSVVDRFAGQLLHEVRAKASWEAVIEWMDKHGVEGEVGQGPQGCLQVLFRALLAAGAKSPSHQNVALERYAPALAQLLESCTDREAAQEVILHQAATFYGQLPQKVLMVADRLMALHLVQASAVAAWSVTTAVPRLSHDKPEQPEQGQGEQVQEQQPEQQVEQQGTQATHDWQLSLQGSTSWEMVTYALDRTTARVQELQEKIAKVKEEEMAIRQNCIAILRQASEVVDKIRKHLGMGSAASAVATDHDMTHEEAEAKLADDLKTLDDPDVQSAGNQDHDVRRWLSSARQAQQRSQGLQGKAEALRQTSLELQSLLPTCVAEPQQALLAAYKGLADLIAKEEQQATTMEADDNDEDAAAPASRIPRHLEVLRRYHRAFVRRYAYDTAVVAAQVRHVLEGREAKTSQIMGGVLQEVLHGDLLDA